MRAISRLQGMQDLCQESWRVKRGVQDRLMELFGRSGYRWLETPVLEPTELFLRKSGGELASRIYSFTDPGGAPVSLRPEFTSSIIRHCLEHAAGIDLPARWKYAGPVFRYESTHPEASGQFTQAGAELVGSSGVMADVEVLSLAAQVPVELGLTGWRVELADLDVLDSVLDAVGVSDRARTLIFGMVPRLGQDREGAGHLADQLAGQLIEEARHLRLTGLRDEDDYLARAIEGLDDGRAKVVLRGLLRWSAADQMGQRDPGEVVDRLLRKLRGGDDESRLRRGLEMAGSLAAVRGDPLAALESASAVVRAAGAGEAALNRLSELVDLLLAQEGVAGHLVLDFGLVRGLAYYNGIVFEVRHPAWPGSLGGGGRYDGLARALGSAERLPALGFAYNLDALLALAGQAGESGEGPPGYPETLVLAADSGSYRQALGAAAKLREQGLPAELEVDRRELEDALAYARRKGIRQVVVVHQDGRRITHAVE